MTTFIEDKKLKNKFPHFFLSYIALKKCTNLMDLCHPLNHFTDDVVENLKFHESYFHLLLLGAEQKVGRNKDSKLPQMAPEDFL